MRSHKNLRVFIKILLREDRGLDKFLPKEFDMIF
jgi:hypothetical protein